MAISGTWSFQTSSSPSSYCGSSSSPLHCLLSLVTLALLELLWTTLPPPPRRAEPASFFLSPLAAPRAIPAFYWFNTNSTILFRSGTSGGYLGIAWALLGDNCRTTWGLTVFYVGLLGDYLNTLRHFVGYLGTTWWMLITLVPLGNHSMTVGGGHLAMLIPCSPLVPPLVLGLQVKNLVLGVVCHLQSASIHEDKWQEVVGL